MRMLDNTGGIQRSAHVENTGQGKCPWSSSSKIKSTNVVFVSEIIYRPARPSLTAEEFLFLPHGHWLAVFVFLDAVDHGR